MSPDHRPCRFNQEVDHPAASSATYWQCRRRSHPVQRMGGVCAMCLTEQLSSVSTRSCAEMSGWRRHRAPLLPSTDPLPPSFGLPSGTLMQSMDFEGNCDAINMSKQAPRCDRQCEIGPDDGMPERSARNSSAGSEQSIASLVERDIDQSRRRYSDVTAGWSKERLAWPRSSPYMEGHGQLKRSRSYSTKSLASSKQTSTSTMASYCKRRNPVVSPNLGVDEHNFRRCNGSHVQIQSSDGAAPLLAKSRSTGSNYNNHKSKLPLCSPAMPHHLHHHHVWSLPRSWHRKFTQTERKHGVSASSASAQNLSSPSQLQADDSIPLMKMTRCHSASVGAKENFKTICEQIRSVGIIKWLTTSPLHLLRRSPPPGKPSSAGPGTASNTSIVHTDMHMVAQSPYARTEGRFVAAECLRDEGVAAIRTCMPPVERNACAHDFGNVCAAMQTRQSNHQESGCQSIAALVSMDAHLIHHFV